MRKAVKIAFVAAAMVPALALAQGERRMLSLDEAISVTLTENPAMKAAAYEERAAQQERRAAIGLRMQQINVTGSYAYMAKDIGFDFNDMKGPVKDLTGKILGLIIDPTLLYNDIQGLLNPMMNADWFLKVQDRSLGFVGGEVTLPIWMGGKINAANRAAKINEKSAAEQGNQTRNALISELVERYFGLALATQVVEVRRQVVKDEILYRSFLDGDDEGLALLMERYGSSLTLYIDGYLHDIHEAEDLMIEAFAYLIAKKPRIRDGGFRAYLYKSARHLAIRCLQKKRKQRSFGFEDLDKEPESDVLVETLVQTAERSQILQLCMEGLNPDYREALYLVYFEGMRHAEAGAVMRKSEKQIADLVYRGKNSLRRALEKEGVTSWYI